VSLDCEIGFTSNGTVHLPAPGQTASRFEHRVPALQLPCEQRQFGRLVRYLAGGLPRLPIAAEDNFALVDLSGPSDDLLPDDGVMQTMAEAAARLSRQWQFLWDFRDLGEEVYQDSIDAFEGVWATLPDVAAPTLLVPPGRGVEIARTFRRFSAKTVEMYPKTVGSTDLDLEVFEEGSPTPLAHASLVFGQSIMGGQPIRAALRTLAGARLWTPLLEELASDHARELLAREDPFGVGEQIEREYMLDATLRSAVTHSVLTQLALQEHEGRIHVIPYHGRSLHQVVAGHDMAILVRPARINHRYWATFSKALNTLEEMINTPGVGEYEIEKLLKQNPFLLGSLGYTEIYHQVVLPRDGAPDLRPDVIAEPADSAWAEILDLKLPSERLIVGRNDRAAQAAGLTEAAAQLRDYAAYFDDRAAAAKIEASLGIRCYKPKLTVVIGRDPSRFTAEEQRRALTAHPDLRVVTYDNLLRAARHRLLL
jgi:Domain of unknown function (DUF4263)